MPKSFVYIWHQLWRSHPCFTAGPELYLLHPPQATACFATFAAHQWRHWCPYSWSHLSCSNYASWFLRQWHATQASSRFIWHRARQSCRLNSSCWVSSRRNIRFLGAQTCLVLAQLPEADFNSFWFASCCYLEANYLTELKEYHLGWHLGGRALGYCYCWSYPRQFINSVLLRRLFHLWIQPKQLKTLKIGFRCLHDFVGILLHNHKEMLGEYEFVRLWLMIDGKHTILKDEQIYEFEWIKDRLHRQSRYYSIFWLP